MNDMVPELVATDPAARLLARLAGGGPIIESVALIVAHPDDEIIAAGGTITRFRDLTLIHVTDGASADPAVARAHGFAAPADYAAARRQELTDALAAACARPVRRVALGFTDGTLAQHLAALTACLVNEMRCVEAVLTHAWEGGHIDHDACARAAHVAAARLAATTGHAPAILEFAGYHRRHGALRTGVFWPDPARPETTLILSESALRRRQAAFAAFRSQGGVLSYFWSRSERFRAAPDYDFDGLPPPLRPDPAPNLIIV